MLTTSPVMLFKCFPPQQRVKEILYFILAFTTSDVSYQNFCIACLMLQYLGQNSSRFMTKLYSQWES